MDTSYLEFLTIQNISKLDINQDFAQKYLEYLLTLIQRNKPVDFIQAANVMQTLSSVFAKKVDHLQEQVLQFTVIFRKLELGRHTDPEAIEGAADNDDPEAPERDRPRQNKKKNEREALLSRFEDITLDIMHIRKSCIKKFCSSDVKKEDAFLIRNKANECPRVKTKDDFSCYIYDSKEEILGRKEEFSINGVLCNAVIPKDDFCLSCNHGEGAAAIDDSVFVVPPEPHQISMDVDHFGHDAMDVDHHNDTVCDDVQPTPDPNPDPNTHSYQNVVEEFLNNSSHNESDTSGFVYFEKINKVGEAVVDFDHMMEAIWTPVSDDNKRIERRINIRNVVKLPESLKNDQEKDKSIPYPTNYVLSDLLLGIFKSKSGVPFCRCFSRGLQEQEEYRRKLLAKGNKKRNRKRNSPALETDTEFRGFNEFGDDDDDDNHGAFEYENDIAPFDDVMPSTSADNLLAPPPIDGEQDYLQGAIQHIEAYQRGLHDDTINDIASKVSSWHDSIRPILDREEERTCFDIHQYGSKILDKFPQNNGKNTLTFASVVQDQPREEIPRFFLSSLLLANSYNVEISKDSQEELVVNDMNLTLLSRIRQHETLDQDMRKEYS